MSDKLSSPSWWWNEVVLANYEEYENDTSCDRKAFNAVITMHHVWERVYWWNVQRVGIPIDEKADKLGKRFRCFLKKKWMTSNIEAEMDALEICANASKHSIQVRKRPMTTATGSIEQIEVGNGGTISATQFLAAAKNFWTRHLRELETMTSDDFKKAIGYEKDPG
jgi:hypothetical protein